MDFFTKKEKEKIQCTACARYCEIENGAVGYCGVKKNFNQRMKLLNYGKFLFLKKKGKEMLVGGLGSNMRISFDPNWDSSLYPYIESKRIGRDSTNERIENLGYEYTSKELVDYVKKQGCERVVFQFNEPLVYIEYILEVCKLKEVEVSLVSTGYFSKEVLNVLLPVVDEISFLFFSTFDKFYIKHCSAQLGIIKKNIAFVFNSGVDLKILYPLIPQENDSEKNIMSLCKFLKQMSPSIPLYFLKFIPSFKMLDKVVTSEEKLKKAVEISKGEGLKNVDFIG